MNPIRLVLRSSIFYWRTSLSVLLGTIVASGVLVGALLVGDSVTHSLRRFALMRLGDIRYAVPAGQRYFDRELETGLGRHVEAPVSAVLQLKGIALHQEEEGGDPVQVNRIQVLGVGPSFWQLSKGMDPALGEDEVALNEKLATGLGVKAGDTILIRVEQPTLLPRDAPLASRKEDIFQSGSFTVKRIVPDSEIGRFSLAANQVVPNNAFVNIEWLQRTVKLVGRANLLLVGGEEGKPAIEDLEAALEKTWRLGHVGITLRNVPVHDTIQLESDRVFLDPALTEAALSTDWPSEGGAAPPKGVGTLTYLVNSISKGGKSIPYSFMVACSPSEDGGLSPVPRGMRDDEIIINTWVARQLSAETGDTVEVAYYELKGFGKFVEKSRSFKIRDVVSMASLGAERDLMPTFPGLTDVSKCREWDIGMPMDEEKLGDKENQSYWTRYRTTPKAIVNLVAGQDMWANRFGNLSAIRFPASAGSVEAIEKMLSKRIKPTDIGLFFMPVRERALNAVSEAMSFGELFVSMSFFLIAAALMLTGLLFVFGVQQRSEEIGTLLAVGYRPNQVRLLFLCEGGVVALIGACIGGALGTQYTRAMIWGLSTYWKGAIAGSAIQYHVETATLVEGIIGSFACALVAIAIAMWRQTKKTARELLAGEAAQEYAPEVREGKGGGALAGLSFLGAIAAVCMVAYVFIGGIENMVPMFFGAGSLLLLAGLGFTGAVLRSLEKKSTDSLTIEAIGVRNASRRRGRSLTAVGLLACGSFMVFAVSSMQEDIAKHSGDRWSGSGGFALFGESTLASPEPLESDKAKEMFKMQKLEELQGVAIVSMKVHEGDNADCLNLNRAQSPTLLGVDPTEFTERGAFMRRKGKDGVWDLLKEDLGPGMIPGVVGDSDTAMWGLAKKVGRKKGDVLAYRDERGNLFKVKLVGKLYMRLSVFQGRVLIDADAFAEKYPSEDGYRMFLVDVPAGSAKTVQQALTSRLARIGLDVTTTTERMLEFYAVQSTYLAMFLVLGGLGLLLGSIGMGIVVMRNVLERRSELAILRCVGFSRSNVVQVVLAEHWMLLMAGLLIGIVASMVAMWPNLVAPGVEIPYKIVGGIVVGIVVVGFAWTGIAAEIGLRGSLMDSLRNE